MIDLVIIRAGFIFFFGTSISVLLQPFGTITLGQDLTIIDREKQTPINLRLEINDYWINYGNIDLLIHLKCLEAVIRSGVTQSPIHAQHS